MCAARCCSKKLPNSKRLKITGDEIAEEIEKMATYYRVTAEEVRASLTQQGGENGIADRLRSRKSVEILVDKAKITDGKWIDEKAAEAVAGAAAEAAVVAEEKPAKKKAEKKEKSAEPKEKKTRKKSE